MLLFSDRSIWTMIHGILVGGGALMALAAALFSLAAARSPAADLTASRQSRALVWLTVFIAVMLWVSVMTGTYVVFPPYRATPPQGIADLSHYPRALIMASPDTAWLHSFAMESKEHMPWIASMLATAVAFVGVRYGPALLTRAELRRMALMLLAICFALVSFVSLMGIFVNKIAPLE